MVQYVLACVLWAKPEVKLIEAPVSEYAVAEINAEYNNFNFYANVYEEKLNSMIIIHVPTKTKTHVAAPFDYQQRSLYAKLEVGNDEATIDCMVKEKPQNP